MLLTTELGGVWKHVDELVQSPNFNLAYRALELCAQAAPNSNQLALCLARARRVHGEKIDLLARVFEEQRRLEAIVKRRRDTRQPEHRFLLALLLNAPDRASLLELVRARFPEADPVERVAAWIEELSGPEKPTGGDALRRLLREGPAAAEALAAQLKGDLVLQLLARG